MKKDLTVICNLLAKEGREEELKQILHKLVTDCKHHDGLSYYSAHQDNADPRKFVFYERFVSQAHLDAHMEEPELEVFLKEVGEYLDGEPQINLLTVVNEVQNP
ncbi:MAG: putative quinol monooxygenase [Desulfovibrio sp.]